MILTVTFKILLGTPRSAEGCDARGRRCAEPGGRSPPRKRHAQSSEHGRKLTGKFICLLTFLSLNLGVKLSPVVRATRCRFFGFFKFFSYHFLSIDVEAPLTYSLSPLTFLKPHLPRTIFPLLPVYALFGGWGRGGGRSGPGFQREVNGSVLRGVRHWMAVRSHHLLRLC